jgi:PAS domain-containing protein
MYEFFSQLFSSDGFPPRWHCGNWTPFHGWFYIASDIGVWSAYTAIPAVLIYFVWRKTTIPFKGIFLLFGAFILACGLTHLVDAIMFWWPAYRLLGLIEFATAVVSWATVVALVPIVPRALSMRSPEELEREIAARRLAEFNLQRANQDLEHRIQERTAELVQANATLEREREWFQTTLAGIGDAVIATDTEGRVTFVNSVAESLTGWDGDEAKAQPLEAIFKIVNQETRQPAPIQPSVP